MKVYHIFCLFCTLIWSACAPGPVLRSPSVEGFVTDARTHWPLPGAQVAVTHGRNSLATSPLPSGLTDARGHYHLAAQHGLGLMNIGPGLPLEQQVRVVISKDGYQPFKTLAYFDDTSATVDAALLPE